LFIQVAVAIDNNTRQRTGAINFGEVANTGGHIPNRLIDDWDLPRLEKIEALKGTHVLMGGWNWKVGSFKQGVFRIEDGEYRFCKLFRPLGKDVKKKQ
jgi:hypothetical protein